MKPLHKEIAEKFHSSKFDLFENKYSRIKVFSDVQFLAWDSQLQFLPLINSAFQSVGHSKLNALRLFLLKDFVTGCRLRFENHTIRLHLPLYSKTTHETEFSSLFRCAFKADCPELLNQLLEWIKRKDEVFRIQNRVWSKQKWRRKNSTAMSRWELDLKNCLGCVKKRFLFLNHSINICGIDYSFFEKRTKAWKPNYKRTGCSISRGT